LPKVLQGEPITPSST
jgi:hypothetical protein